MKMPLLKGILKYKHNLKQTFADYSTVKEAVDDAVKKYNEIRIHDSCGRLTPQEHEQKGVLKKYWKPKVYRKTECRTKKFINCNRLPLKKSTKIVSFKNRNKE
jgi:putative transposase